ncbi:MAG: hypothetical protein IPM35_18820 [Myxococcales bacterium]|nr:hypothetical protein [Myxococcales bacterium]
MSDEKHDKDVILARRRRLMVSALAGIAVAQSGCEKSAQPCLSVEVVRDGGAPMPCLSPPPIPADAAWASRPDAGADASAAPQPCLEVPAPPKPR